MVYAIHNRCIMRQRIRLQKRLLANPHLSVNRIFANHRAKVAAMLQTVVSNSFFEINIVVFSMKFRCNLSPMLQLSSSAVVQIMAWRREEDKLLSWPMMPYITAENIIFNLTGWGMVTYDGMGGYSLVANPDAHHWSAVCIISMVVYYYRKR